MANSSMVYREFGKTGIKMSALGFGAMRLPMKDTAGGGRLVDYDKAVPMLHRAFELGVNYIDTAPYYCEKDSETAVGMALNSWKGPDKVYLSTKNPVEDASGEHWRGRLEASLKKLNRDAIDFYHMWGISLESFQTKIDVKDGPIEAAMRAKEEGLIRHLSFSFHDKPENMVPLIDSGYFESVLCQYNLLDRSNEASIAHAHKKGLGVVIMGPVGGGRLGSPSDVIRGMLKKDIRSTAEMALRFVLANPNVNIALSGMQTVEMVEENAKVASIDGVLTKEELAEVEKMLEENKRLAELYCTGCKYCMPCPQGINIPHVFSLMNYHKVYGLTDYARKEYATLLTPLDDRKENFQKERGLDASHCVECAKCQGHCPQHLEIIAQLKETHAVLANA
jgi:predicted aldo/keto reductase-like oxidoreductase